MKRLLLFLAVLSCSAPLFSQPSASMDPSAIRLALKKMRVLGTVLYVAAHPDDENTAFLAAMAQGRLFRAAYLSVTRGEGGQNLIGSEQGDALGIVRTRELLAARRIDGAEQYFTRAIDFGYSKSTEETLRFWGHEQTLGDVVWIIRLLQPDVVVTRFTPTAGGHGNHTASALLAAEAWSAAGDSSRFPEQLATVRPWKPKRLLWNVFRFGNDSLSRQPGSISLDLGVYSPLLGKSFAELAGEARSMHKSQGFGAAQNRGQLLNAFQHTAGDTAHTDLFDGIVTGWERFPGGATIDSLLSEIIRRFADEKPSASLPRLFALQTAIERLAPGNWREVKLRELKRIIQSCAGLWVEALAASPVATPGSTLPVTVFSLNRSAYPLVLKRISTGGQTADPEARLEENRPRRDTVVVRLSRTVEYTQPYWLRTPSTTGSYGPASPANAGRAENGEPLMVVATFSGPDGILACPVPVRYKSIDPVEGEVYRPFTILPAISVQLADQVLLFPDGLTRQVQVILRGTSGEVSGTVRLSLPDHWRASPAATPFRLESGTDERAVTFAITPEAGAASGTATAVAEVNGREIRQSVVTVNHAHIPLVTLLQPAQAVLLRTAITAKTGHVGYVMGSGDEIPGALRQLGYDITLVTDNDLAEGDLSRFDVIMTGVRAHNTRPHLRAAYQRLMDYVKSGGTYVVQYVTAVRGESESIGPYPLHISRDRVTEEDAAVTLLSPSHPLLNTPNRITDADFRGWVQERGLYFPDRWDARYDSLLSCADAGEPQKHSGLLYASYGKGHFVFNAYAFFRQLPAGVVGPYRLLANILSLRGERISQP